MFLVDLNNCREVYDNTIPITLEDEEEDKEEINLKSIKIETGLSSNESSALGKQTYSQRFSNNSHSHERDKVGDNIPSKGITPLSKK